MKIYFAGSISGGRGDADLYLKIIDLLKEHGEVLTEFIGSDQLSSLGEQNLSDKEIHDRDVNWLLSSDVIVAEITTPSLGVGYEIGRAYENNIKVLALYRNLPEKRVSAMIKGIDKITVKEYQDLTEIKEFLSKYFTKTSTK